MKLTDSVPKKIAIALSGGVDSVVLLHLLLPFRDQSEIIALHVNYGLRGKESERDEKFCQKLCQENEISFCTLKITAEQRKSRKGLSLQEWARKLRYEYFEAFQNEGFTIATAHQRDDLLENFFLRLFRGHSAIDLLGMNSFKSNIWRPLLDFSKEEIEKFAQKKKIKFCKDSSNDKSDYSRNFLRNKILPSLQEKFSNFADSSLRAGKLSFELGRFFIESKRPVWTNHELELVQLADLPIELQCLLVKQFIRQQSANAVYATQVQLETILSYAKPTALDLSPAWRLVRTVKSISLSKISSNSTKNGSKK